MNLLRNVFTIEFVVLAYTETQPAEWTGTHKKLQPMQLCRLAFYTIFPLLYPVVAFCDPNIPFFSAPYSGEKVAEYAVSLPVSRNQDQLFKIPTDCPAVHEALLNGANRWGNRVERSMWRKVQLDCDYVRFLSHFSVQPLHDFVSGYDFMNAKLQDISFPLICNDQGKHSAECEDTSNFGIADFPFLDFWLKDEVVQERQKTCRIENGIYRGRLYYDQTGVHCVRGDENPLFRVIAVDFADVNGDDYLDAVLRLIPLGRGQSRAPIVLPLTRKAPDGVFTIPQNLPGPLPGP